MTSVDPFSLNNKRILITGASSGIGKSIALECSKRGANLFVTGRNEKRLLETYHNLHSNENYMFIADLSVEDELISLVDNLPPLDGVVQCQGITKTLPVRFATKLSFEQIFNINLFSQVELIRHLIRKKKINSGASVIFIASIGGISSYNTGNVVYGTSKAALNSYMKYCAKELAPKNIRVNSICPGLIETPLTEPHTISKQQLDAYKKKYLLKRFGCPQDIAYGAIYLLSEASSWVTGSSLFIDGGGDCN